MRQTEWNLTSMRTSRIRSGALTLLVVVLVAWPGFAPAAEAFEIPPVGSPVFIQTSGAQAGLNIGDWYTNVANGSVQGYTYITIHVPTDWPSTEDLHIDLFSPEMNAANALDEARNASDTTFFEVYAAGTLVSVEVIDGLLDIDADRTVTAADDGTLFVTGDANGIAAIDGFVDVNDDAVIDATDDGTFAGFSIVDGYVDVDGDGTVPEASDDDYLWATPSPGTPTVAHSGNDSCQTTTETESLIQCRYLPQAGAGTWKRAVTLTAPVAAGRYVLRSQTGDRSGTAGINDDDNAWRVRIALDDDANPVTLPPANGDNPDLVDGTNDELVIGLIQVTYQHNEAGNETLSLYEFVGASQPSVAFHNFDIDGNVSVDYISPSGGSTAGTVSGNAVWNNGGTGTSRGGDTILTPEEGWWRIDTLFTPNNQLIQEGRTRVPGFFEQPPTPIVEVTKSDGQSRISPGDRVTWTITFSNVSDDPAKNGGVTPGAAVNIVLSDNVPAQTTYVGCGINPPFTGTCSESAGVVTYSVNEALVAGAMGSVTLTADVDLTAAGVIFNEVTIDFEDSANVATFDVETDADTDLLPGTCFAAARGPNTTTVDRLIAIDRTGGGFQDIGPTTGATDIRALAFEPGTDTLYSVDNAAAGGPTLGTHDLTDGSFTPIGAALTTCTASGGPRTITAVEGLSFDPVNANLWASTSSTTVAADILFQLDRTTGALVPNLFGPGVDCLDTSLNSILDIAVDPTGAPFYASDGAQLYIVNTVTGVATLVGPFGAGAVTDMAGLGFNNAGNLSGTTGASNTPASGDDELWLIDETTGAATFVYDLKAAPSVYPDYESLDCLTDPSNRLQGVVFNDLNTNGVYDPSSGDLGQGGVTVRLYVDTNNDGLVDGGDTLIQSTTTSVDGSYGFFVGVPGNYVVDTVYPGTYPATALLTTDNVEEADFAGTGETDVGNNFGFSLPSDLAVTKTSNATSTVVAGQTIVYTITISNPAGPLQTGITVADPLPAGTIYVAQSTVVVGFDNVGAVTKDNVPAGVNPDLTDGTPPDLVVVADAFQLNTGQSMTVTFSVTVEDPLDYTRGQILNIATVDSNQSPPVQASVSDPLSQGGSIGDRVWLDLDGDGVQDVGEPGLANITVQLVQVVGAAGGADDVVVATTETSLDGSYTFTGIAPETYYVNVVDADVPSGLVRSPNNGNADPTDGPPLGAPGRTFTITAEEDYRDADFGYRPADGTAVVGDFVWIDADDDGKQDPGEPGVGGVTLDLVNARTGAVIASTTTTGDGRYLFTNVARGKYRVDVTDTAGVLTSYTLTNGPQSSKDPTVPLNIAPGESYLRADFGYFKSGLLSISDDVWLDTNGNGLRDPGEQGVADVTVNLVRTYGIIDGKVDIDRDGSITTGDDGLFEGFAIIDGVLDLDGDGAAGEANGDDDGTIGGVTVDDGLLDLDGDTTAGETNGDDSGTFTGQIIASTVTDANGEFTFSGLENGNYEIVVEDKAGKLKGKRGTTAPGVAKRLGRSLAGADLDDENFGYANSGQVTGVVWRDVDGDGVRDVGEAGVPGVTVELRDGVCTPGSNCPTATTDASGSYSFDGLEPGTYTVVITDDAGVLLGSTQTGDPDESGTCATCDDQGAAAVGSASGPSIDFGYQADLADVSGTVFEDLDADGVEEAGEGGIEGVTLDLVPVYTIVDGLVDLDGDGSITATDDGSLEGIAIIDGFFDVDGDGTAGEVNGDDDGFVNGFTIIDGALDLDGDGTAGEVTEDSGILEGQAVATTTTDGSGNYLFADVLDGDYKVKVTDSAGLLDGYTLTSGLDAIDVTVAGSDREDIDFGYVAAVETGSIGDSIFFDLDRDGDQDAGEGGIVGVTVDLAPAYAIVDGKVDINGDGSITAADDGLFEGFTVIDGVLDLDGDGIAGEVNGDDDGTVGGITVVNGLLDLDGDATAGETNGDDDGTFLGSVIASTTTDASGKYVFDGLPPGSYAVDVTDTAGVLTGLALSAGADPTAVIQLAAGEVNLDADFGYSSPPASGSLVGDTIYYDADGDGFQDPGEVGIAGVTVNLLDPGPDGFLGTGDDPPGPLATAVTDAAGQYLFTGVTAGKRYVEVDTSTLPSGYNTTPTQGPATWPYDVLAGEDILYADFGFDGGTPGSIGDTVYRDINGDGTQDGGEPGIEGVTLSLRPVYAVIDGLVDVDGDGDIDGDDDGFVKGIRVIDGALDVNGDTVIDATDDGTYEGVTVIDGYLDVDGDTVVNPDLDDDGTVNGPDIGTAVTDAAGVYTFLGVPAGEYVVEVSDTGGILGGLNNTQAPAGTFTIIGDGSPGDTVLTADFGYAPSEGTGTIGGTVWHDTNQTAADGVLDPEESGMEQVTVELWLDVDGDGVLTPGVDNLVRTATSDENGEYEFLSVPFGDYLVTVSDTNGVLTGFQSVLSLDQTSDGHGKADPFTVTLESGSESEFTADFAYEADDLTPQSISGTTFFDADGLGTLDGADPGVEGVTVYLYRDLNGDGILDPEDALIGTQLSDVNGDYTFDDLPNGDFLVAVDTTGTFLDDMRQTTQQAELDVGIQPVTIVAADVVDQDFGFTVQTTAVLVSSFSAGLGENGVVVRWETASEVGAMGFYLYRWSDDLDDYSLVNEQLLPAAVGSPQGGVYELVDPGAQAGAALRYSLVEIESGGAERRYGPFDVEVSGRSSLQTERRVRGRSRPAVVSERLALRRSTVAARAAARVANRPVLGVGPPAGGRPSAGRPGRQRASYLELSVVESGLYRVTAGEIGSLAGIGSGRVLKALELGQLRLTNQGESVAWTRVGDALVFYGESLDSPYTADNVYRLELGAGETMLSGWGDAPPVEATTVSMSRVDFEENHFAATTVSSDADLYYWAYLSAGDPTWGSFSTSVQATAAEPGEATLRVRFQSMTSTPATDEHRIRVNLNGTDLGTAVWDGTAAHNGTFTVPSGVLLSGGNSFELTAELGAGVPYSVVLVDGFELEYPRLHRAVGDSLVLRAEAFGAVSVEGLTSGDIWVADVTDAKHPVWLEGVTVTPMGGGFRATFVAPDAGRRYAVATTAALGVPGLAARIPSTLRESAGAEYVVIAPQALQTGAQALADYRTAMGLSTMVVDLEEIYGEFGHGLPTPEAIHGFLAYAWSEWPVAPRFVALAGDGTYDYHDAQGQGDNLVPPLLVATPQGMFASDVMLGDVSGDDGVPEIAVGRIPVVTNSELEAYVGKLSAYEGAGLGAGVERLTMLADGADPAGNFPVDSDQLLASVPETVASERIYLSELPVATARSETFSVFASGTDWVNYLGHGGFDRFANEGLLLATDAASLTVGDRLPVVSSLTCSVGRFEVPGWESLAEALVLAPNGGAAVVWAPSGQSYHFEATSLNEALFAAMFSGSAETVGELILETLATHQPRPGFEYLRAVYNLVGDPAYRVR